MAKAYLELLLAPIGLAAVLLAGCDWLERREFEADLAKRVARADARVVQLDLAESTTGELAPMVPETRLLITPAAVHVDNTGLVADWWRSESVRAAQWSGEPALPSEWGSLDELVVDAPDVVRMRGGKIDPSDLRAGAQRLLIEPLYDLMKRVAGVSKRHGVRTATEFTSRLNLYVSPATSYATLVRVLYTVGQAEFSDFYFALRAGESVVELPVRHDRCAPECGTRPQRDDAVDCMYPMFSLSRKELVLRTSRRREGKWQKETEAERLCKSVPHAGGRADLAALERLLADDRRRMTPCKGARVEVAEEVPWSDLAPVLETLRQGGGFVWQTLSVLEARAGAGVGCDPNSRITP